jgi:hypothetical protein
LSTSKTRRYSMSTKAKMLKAKRLLFGRDITDQTRDGLSFTLIRQRRLEPRDTIHPSDSTWTEHSTSDQECQWEELLNV